MRLPTPRVIAIDDESKHLQGLTQGLNRYGTACLPVLFAGQGAIAPCPHARVIFADLHLSGGPPGNHAQDFATIGGLLEDTIQPTGPYFIVLWTRYPDQAVALRAFLAERLQDVAKPFTVVALDKNDHLDAQGDVRNPEKLVDAIKQVVAEQPQIGALLNWEERVLGATADTVSSMSSMAETAAEDADTNAEVGRLLRSLAVASAGRDHVDEDRFRAVNEALLPILADRIASMRSREADDQLWQAAIGDVQAGAGLSNVEIARLNRLLHIERSTEMITWTERGSVIPLPNRASGDKFRRHFGHEQDEAASRSFGCQNFDGNDARFRWVLVQSQAACDYAQVRPGPLPFHLGLCLPAENARKGRLPAALWTSPRFEFHGETFLHVSASFQMPLPRTARNIDTPLFRLREPLLNDLIYQLHGYSARPGTISFR